MSPAFDQHFLCRTGVSPVIWNVFVSIPLNSTTTTYLQQTLPQIAAADAICLLTVEPFQGLAAVTPAAVKELASYIMQAEQVSHWSNLTKPNGI